MTTETLGSVSRYTGEGDEFTVNPFCTASFQIYQSTLVTPEGTSLEATNNLRIGRGIRSQGTSLTRTRIEYKVLRSAANVPIEAAKCGGSK